MLLMPIVTAAVPDTPDAPGATGLLSDEAGKAELDAGQLDVDALGPPVEDKVELDLEDAPFLLPEEEKAPPPPPPAAQSLALSPDGDAPKKKKFSLDLSGLLANKKLLIIVVAVLVLLVGGGAAWFLLRKKEAPPPPPEAAVQKIVVPQQAAPSPAEPARPAQTILSWEPFWVEQKDAKGAIRFLVVKFSAPTENQKLVFEAQAKKVVIRDAVYYYLKNKSLTYLTDAANAETLKKDILAIMNEYLSIGKLEDLLIENYLVK
ncbi:flagellar basal body-associated protein FliL [Nitratidesulfovibrio sp. SRB-5]|uniref:flagellar basal body-associated FliL family protein n=1 Tax=Nitratidesulfovibrio sp. SRB-5 TaxID=2872636 RepID=UPI00102670F0|nr:flagellar basal body-associated FliL family protein [Nitratidesulfovibrio sp. SRB-5]MBZ2173373.1 flagellar basal body-associated FliL family protein [Nitratidesulfovibrio sp. SRB-5]RXF76355.1 flagellar basal body-associated FliL family protein [Desulfovibrio sp. DS-1]